MNQTAQSWWFIFYKDQLLLEKKEDGILITFLKVIGMMGLVVAAFGVSILNSLADLQEKYPIIEDIVFGWMRFLLLLNISLLL